MASSIGRIFRIKKKQGLAPAGTENHGGPILSVSGLLFIGAAYDEKLRAIDTKIGKTVWEYQLSAGGYATPVTYMVNGKQYIEVAACSAGYGLKGGSKFLAFSLE
ncbi:MAG: quinoprotein glucose dehydrogenase [Algoriphagus sp.]|jgi:quinoprotein glucose dehydrogenase